MSLLAWKPSSDSKWSMKISAYIRRHRVLAIAQPLPVTATPKPPINAAIATD